MSVKAGPDNIPSTLREQVVPAVDVDHAILQDAFPLVLDSGDLCAADISQIPTDCDTTAQRPYLIVRAKDNVALSESAFLLLLLTLCI